MSEMDIKIGFDIDELPLDHILLFLPWIQLRLTKEKLTQYSDTFDLSVEQRDKLIKAMIIKDNDKHTKDLFELYHIIFDENVTVARKMSKWFIEESNDIMATNMLFNDVNPDAFKVYRKEFIEHPKRIIPKLISSLPMIEIVDALKKRDSVYCEIAEEALKTYVPNKFLNVWVARCWFLIKFITAKPRNRKPEYWFDEFLVACNNHPRTRVYSYFIDSNFLARIEEYHVKLDAERIAPEQFTQDLVSGDPPTSPRPQADFGKRYVNVSSEMSRYTLYKYQEELAAQAKEGKNTIIVAPTGSGKTLVAVDIIADHLRNNKRLNKISRVVMFVPTIPLVEQQSNYIKEKLGNEYCVTKMSGSEKKDVLIDIMIGDIIVMTPQIFINMLLSPLKRHKIYLIDFTLMVFDECHHCSEGHPYNLLMDYVRNSEIKPQIVGLTASTGSGKARGGKINPEDTLDHICALCARLTAVTISSVKIKENVEELLSRISQPLDDFIAVLPPRHDKFAHEIALICDMVENHMNDELRELQKAILSLKEEQIKFQKEGDSTNGSTKTSIGYYSKFILLRSEVQRKMYDMQDKRLYVLKCLSLINILYYTLKYNELFPAKLAMNYLVARLEEFEENDLFLGKENDCILGEKLLTKLRKLFQLVQDKAKDARNYMEDSENKPILSNLIEILQSEKPNSRIIIFVDMRKVGSDLCRYLNQRPEIIELFGRGKVGYIASTNQGSSKYGQTRNEQEMILDYFKNGSINILVATSVAEEGLDVAACNLVIKYNSVGSEKAFTQRKGRARAQGSKAVLLALEEGTMRREFENVKKEILMNLCIRALQVMPESELLKKISKEKANMETLKQQEQDSQVRRRDENKVYELLCRDCSRVFCKSDEIFSLNNNEYICCNNECWNQTTIKSNSGLKGFNVAIRCGEWLCSCGCKRGNVIKYGGLFLPAISSGNFSLKLPDNDLIESTMSKKWEWIRIHKFSCLPISSNQLYKMAGSLFNYDHSMFKEAEKNAEIAVLNSIREHKQSSRINYDMAD